MYFASVSKEFVECTQELRSKDIKFCAPGFLSFEGGHINFKEIESRQRSIAECLIEDKLRTNETANRDILFEVDPICR